jgi:hypothetical protein
MDLLQPLVSAAQSRAADGPDRARLDEALAAARAALEATRGSGSGSSSGGEQLEPGAQRVAVGRGSENVPA